jgi:tetratricopeptide (TPR) repeat protein
LLLPSAAFAEQAELYIAQGIQKITEEKMQDALNVLNKALDLSPQSPEANYYAGVAHARLGQFKEAEDLFIKTIEFDETILEAYFELGRLYYMTDRCNRADEKLSYYIARSEDEALRSLARQILETCEEKTEKKSYRVDLILGSQYDSNVIIEPENPTVSAEDKSDYRGLVYIKAHATPIRGSMAKLNVDYSFYQSIHSKLDDYDVHYHKIRPQIDLNISAIVKPSVGYQLAYTALGGDSYSLINTFYTKIVIIEGQKMSTDVVYEYRSNDYWNSKLARTNELRDGHQNTFGIKQNFSFRKVSANIFYFTDLNRAEAHYWSYNGYRGGTALGFSILSPLKVNISGEYNERRYRDDYPGFGRKRIDKMQQYSIGLKYTITKRIALILNYLYTRNDSNLVLYDYKRHITGVFLRIGLL